MLSFEASADKVAEEYCCTVINDTKVLKFGILYGANASGKTNVLLVSYFICKIAISPQISKIQPVRFTSFLLYNETEILYIWIDVLCRWSDAHLFYWGRQQFCLKRSTQILLWKATCWDFLSWNHWWYFLYPIMK